MLNNLKDCKYYIKETNTLYFKDVNDNVNLAFENYKDKNFNIVLENSQINLVETYIGDIKELNYQINVSNNSSLNRLAIIVNTSTALNINKEVNNCGKYISMQIDLTENDVKSIENINMIEENASANIIDGIYAINSAKKQYFTNLNHNVNSCVSRAQIFAINNDFAHVSIFTDAYIKQGASSTKTTQEGRIINLSPTCSGIVLPNLHIDENDVEASHSCSVGSVNKDHLYYLQTRGFSTKQAENILIRGYFNPLLKNITDETTKNSLIDILEKRIG